MASKIISFQEDIHIVVVVVVCGNENEKEIGCNKEHTAEVVTVMA